MISRKLFKSISKRFNCEKKIFPIELELKMLDSFIFVNEGKICLRYKYHGERKWSYSVQHIQRCLPKSFAEMKDLVYERLECLGLKKSEVRRSIHQRIINSGFITTFYRRNDISRYEKYMEIFRARLSKIDQNYELFFICSGGRSWAYVINDDPSTFTPFWEMAVLVSQKIRTLKKCSKK